MITRTYLEPKLVISSFSPGCWETTWEQYFLETWGLSEYQGICTNSTGSTEPDCWHPGYRALTGGLAWLLRPSKITLKTTPVVLMLSILHVILMRKIKDFVFSIQSLKTLWHWDFLSNRATSTPTQRPCSILCSLAWCSCGQACKEIMAQEWITSWYISSL